MYNFENEIKQIKNKQLDDFFGNDYFHDGFILSIDWIGENSVRMKFSCEREWGEQSCKGNWIDHYVNEVFHYNVYFKNCIYLNMEINDFPIEYINGRFKNSAKLELFNKESDNSNYHLRMQIACGGYIDIIFSDFTIQKLKGEIPTFEYRPLNNFKSISNRFDPTLDISEIREISIDENNIKRGWAIIQLFNLNDRFANEAALKALDSEEDDEKIAAIFVLGQISEVEIITKLFTLWTITEYPIMKRNILDAIEKIMVKNN